MALAEQQVLLARLFTDAPLRQEFFTAPEHVAARFGLGPAETARFVTIDKGEVEAFARSLLKKRALDARKVMPLTARALGKKFDELLSDAVAHPADARHRADSAALTQNLTQRAARGEIAPWIVDIARFEYAFIEAAQPGLRLRRFHYDVAALSRVLAAGDEMIAQPRASFGIWARLPGGRLRWRLFRI